MNNLIDVFLMLATESKPSPEETAHAWPLKPVIREILGTRAENLKHKGLAVEPKANGHLEVRASLAVLILSRSAEIAMEH